MLATWLIKTVANECLGSLLRIWGLDSVRRMEGLSGYVSQCMIPLVPVGAERNK